MQSALDAPDPQRTCAQWDFEFASSEADSAALLKKSPDVPATPHSKFAASPGAAAAALHAAVEAASFVSHAPLEPVMRSGRYSRR
jgi:hypothetical protein